MCFLRLYFCLAVSNCLFSLAAIQTGIEEFVSKMFCFLDNCKPRYRHTCGNENGVIQLDSIFSIFHNDLSFRHLQVKYLLHQRWDVAISGKLASKFRNRINVSRLRKVINSTLNQYV